MHTLADMGRTDGPPDAIGHGMLSGAVTLFVTDAVGDDEPLEMHGAALALLGTADGPTLTTWFDALAAGGTVLDALQERPWNATDGQVRDRYGVRWLIGFEHAAA
ncbi:VOC family protein [Agrococcus sp. Ld7]|uniref:VOC family protein n=1 Tax=Agrococcus sp. Ld7 TaxID=649148 RepID=UPI003867D683